MSALSAMSVREKPVLFNDAMVRAILDGRKTCTRRLAKRQPTPFGDSAWAYRDEGIFCRRSIVDRLREDSPWKAGDVLWVRECWAQEGDKKVVAYRADGRWGSVGWDDTSPTGTRFYPVGWVNPVVSHDGIGRWVGFGMFGSKWKPSIHMPRWASRISLRVVAVDPVQIRELSEQDAKEEGLVSRVVRSGVATAPLTVWGTGSDDDHAHSPLQAFRDLWESLYPGSWDRNDWAYANEFELIKERP